MSITKVSIEIVQDTITATPSATICIDGAVIKTNGALRAASDELLKIAETLVSQRDSHCDRAMWIDEHGSPCLRRMVALGVDHEKVYCLERKKYEQAEFDLALAAARPGWKTSCQIKFTSEAFNGPPMDVLSLLVTQRDSYESCQVGILCNCWWVIVDSFRGRPIYYDDIYSTEYPRDWPWPIRGSPSDRHDVGLEG